MPLYEYECEKCGAIVELRQGFSDPPLEKCQKCSGPMRRLITPPAIIFKGSGWYVTDNPTQDRKKGVEKEKAQSPDSKQDTKKDTSTKEKSAEKVGV